MKKKILNVFIILFILFIPLKLNAAKTKKLEICNSTAPAGIMYTYIDESKHPSYVSNPFEIEVYNFVAEGGKTVYCIHGGKLGPASGNCKTTQLVTDFLSDGCDSGGNLYECGLVRIISHALKNGYGYVETMTALRLWTAAESGEPGAGIATNSELGQRVTIKQKVYTNTAELVNKNYDPRNPEKLEYVLFQPTGNEIAKSFELYNVATTAPIYTATFKLVDKNYEFNKDKRVTIEITTTLKDVNNIIEINPLKNAKFISKSCSGNTCSVVLEATVDLSRSGNLEIPIEITYKDPEDIMSKIKEYKIPIDEYQTFLVLEDSEEIKKKITVNIGAGECNSDTTCCPGDTYPENSNCKCDDINIKYEIPNNCASGTEGLIEDPKLCAIAIKNSGRYKLDDISYDGKNLCSVYCREKYEFKFMPGLEAIAGRTYKYDVKGWELTTSDKYLTAVKATRECTSSQINYKQWKADYIKINTDILNAWNYWKEWEAKANNEDNIPESKSCPTCSGGCCGGSPAVKDPVTGAIIKPAVPCVQEGSISGGSDSWTWYKWTNAKYNITLPNGNIEGKDGSGQSGNDGISCSCSTCPVSASARGHQGTSASVEAGKAEATYRGLLTRRTAMINAIENCNYQLSSGVISKIKGYEYKSTVDFDYDDKYGEGTSKMTEFDSDRVKKDSSMSYCTGSSDDGLECKIDKLCPECNSEINTTINGSLSREDLIRWECSGSETSAKCTNTKYAAPKSKAAYVSVMSEEATYQKNNFYTQIGTGIISTSQGKNYIQLEDSKGQTNYLYPLELNKKDGVYETILRYEGINEDFRKQLNLTKIEDIEYKCNIKVKNEMPLCEGECPVSCDGGVCPPNKPSLGFIFRPIDMGNIFPNEYRTKGRNWTTPNAISIMDVIEERNEDFWLKIKPKYTVTLLPENLKKIKKYNDDQNFRGGYQDYSIECQTDPNKSDFGHCGSIFLKDILKNDYANKFERIPFEAGLNDGLNNYYWKKAK